MWKEIFDIGWDLGKILLDSNFNDVKNTNAPFDTTLGLVNLILNGDISSINIDLISSLIYNPNNLPRNSFIDNELRDKVEPKLGSVILCDLSPLPGSSIFNLNVEHTGIYVGNGEIIHRNGDGRIEKVTPKKFLERLGGLNCAVSCYVSCNNNESIENIDSFSRAIVSLYVDNRGYSLFNNNCHHFTEYCLTGRYINTSDSFTFTFLENLLIKYFNVNNWRVWDINKTINRINNDIIQKYILDNIKSGNYIVIKNNLFK